MNFLKIRDRYIKILNVICDYYGIDEKDLMELLKNSESKFLILLLLKNHQCMNTQDITQILNYKNKRSLNYSLKKAEERLLISSEFRKKYFEIEEDLLK